MGEQTSLIGKGFSLVSGCCISWQLRCLRFFRWKKGSLICSYHYWARCFCLINSTSLVISFKPGGLYFAFALNLFTTFTNPSLVSYLIEIRFKSARFFNTCPLWDLICQPELYSCTKCSKFIGLRGFDCGDTNWAVDVSRHTHFRFKICLNICFGIRLRRLAE